MHSITHVGRRAVVTAAVVVVALVAVVVVSFRAGEDAEHTVTVRSGLAYSSGSQAIVTVDGVAYNLPIDATSDWYDDSGGLHLGGTPPCLATPGLRRITFATVTYRQSGALQRSVVWVRCPEPVTPPR